jgi:hypothetical protein
LSRIPDAHPFVDRWDVRFREEPDEEEEENDKKGEGDREDGDEDDDQNGGYSVYPGSYCAAW